MPVNQPLAVRTGGFGGPEGLADYLRTAGITHVVDATHPFADTMSRNAAAACAANNVPLLALVRPPWSAVAGDRWTIVSDLEAAVATLPDAAARVFLAIGRQHLAPFAAKPQHTYILRVVDPPDAPPPLPNADIIVARGPFTEDGDLALLRAKSVTHVVSRNSGGGGARSKIDAARRLSIPVIMIARPTMIDRRSAETVDDVLAWLAHDTCRRA